MVTNSVRVPVSQWRKWNESERAVFNSVYYQMAHNQNLFLHPKAKLAVDEHWETTVYNAAWTAADAAKDVR